MTRAERIKIAHEACELIHVEDSLGRFACHALAKDVDDYRKNKTVKNFAAFYDQRESDAWQWDTWDRQFRKHQRIMAVLFWATCPESIRKEVMRG